MGEIHQCFLQLLSVVQADLTLRCSLHVAWILSNLLLRHRMLDGDACLPHESCCPPQLLQFAIELVPQQCRFWSHVPPQSIMQLTVLCTCSAVLMPVLHLHISDSLTLNLLYKWAFSLLCPVLSLNRITCSGLFSLWRIRQPRIN